MSPVPFAPREAAVAVVVQTVTMAVLFAVALALLADGEPFDGSLRDFAVVAAIHAVDAAVIGALLLGAFRRRPAELGWGRSLVDPGGELALGVAGALGCSALVAAGIVVSGGGLDGVRDALIAVPWPQRLLGAWIGVGAALVEETVFRGVLQPVLVRRWGRGLGILAAALIFSAYHLKFAPLGFAVKAAFGVVLGVLREGTEANRAPALAHLGVWALVGFA